ncbi:DUF535 family protein [Mesoterricola silvestris]|uniref:Membrane protein n=1 Tax=Mesoterricola silvestris TaxID=2927979 RepID=A0AA48GIB5_9BACT|nr:DUF535 family protein [Mesoterricola silvestris]BDU73466.1 membrane protein [Mesoterricola silvestris]
MDKQLSSTWKVSRRAWSLSHEMYRANKRKFKRNLRWAVTAAVRQAVTRPWFEFLATPAMAPFVQANPRLAFRPMNTYMSKAWGWERRVKVILETYEFINAMDGILRDAMLRPEGRILASADLGKGLEARFRLGFDPKFRKEGELCLFLELSAYEGPVMGMALALEHRADSHWVAYVGAIQGRLGGGEEVVKVATKAMHGLRPKFLMVFLAQEMARALRVGHLLGVGNRIQVYRANPFRILHPSKDIRFDYDALWKEAEGEEAEEGWFRLPLRTQRRAEEDFPSNKRAMYRKRYALMDDLSRQIKIQLAPFGR